MTDLVTLFTNIDRIALSLERIATALEDRNAGGDNTISVSVSGETATVEKPKRTRRTKEQIAADEAAAKAAAQPETTTEQAPAFQPTVGQPAAVSFPQTSEPVGVAQIPAAVPAAVAPPALQPPVTVPAGVIQPAPAPVAAPLAQPVAAQATVTTPAPTATTAPVAAPAVLPQATGTAEGDFAQLYQILGPVWAVGRDHFVNNFSQYGLTLPISDPDNNALPGAAFRALSAEHRAHLLQTTSQLAAQIQARAGQL